jgi:hypothetical protein
MRYYCTVFDINYITHAKSLYNSLLLHSDSFTLFMCCMCDESYKHLENLKLSNARLVHFTELEEFIPELTVAKSNRSKVEYLYTCSSAICYFTLKVFKEIDIITYLDADLYFFTSPEPIFTEFGDKSIGIMEHGFNWLSKRNLKYGKYNVGWINFRNDENGLLCSTQWMENCIEWCYQRVEKDRYADQKYLNYWPEKYNGVTILKHKGANLGPWNVSNYKLSCINNEVFVDKEPLIFYHFANLKQVDDYIFKTALCRAFISTSGVLKTDIYIPYIKELLKNMGGEHKFIAKQDTHLSGINFVITKFSRFLRQTAFPDSIEIKE